MKTLKKHKNKSLMESYVLLCTNDSICRFEEIWTFVYSLKFFVKIPQENFSKAKSCKSIVGFDFFTLFLMSNMTETLLIP
jgi:hypothetical protein